MQLRERQREQRSRRRWCFTNSKSAGTYRLPWTWHRIGNSLFLVSLTPASETGGGGGRGDDGYQNNDPYVTWHLGAWAHKYGSFETHRPRPVDHDPVRLRFAVALHHVSLFKATGLVLVGHGVGGGGLERRVMDGGLRWNLTHQRSQVADPLELS